MKSQPINQPTRRTVEALFRELGQFYYGDSEECQRLHEQYNALEARLLNNAKLKALQKRLDAANAKARKQKGIFKAKLQNVRQQYYAHGLTPAVQKAIQKLIAEPRS